MAEPFSIAVIIPAHNAQPWLQRALDSVLAQTVPPREIVVVDDHSTDATAAIARACGPAVRVLAAAQRGSNPARNLGLQHVTAEWVQFLDADDYLLPDKLARQIELIRAQPTPVDLVYSPNVLFYGDTPEPTGPAEAQATQGEDDPVFAFLSNRGFQTGAMLWRRDALLAIGAWNESVPRCQDNELALRALEAELRAVWSPYAGAVYTFHERPSLSRAVPLATIQGNVALLERCCAWLRARNRFETRHTTAAQRRLLALLWSAHLLDSAWTRENYRRLHTAGLVRPRWFGSKIETCLRLFGWDITARLRAIWSKR